MTKKKYKKVNYYVVIVNVTPITLFIISFEKHFVVKLIKNFALLLRFQRVFILKKKN